MTLPAVREARDTSRVLVTGGSGFLGTNLVGLLAGLGHEVLNLDLTTPRDTEQHRYWTKVNLLDGESLLSAVRDFAPRYLVHLAARTDLDERDNLDGYAANFEGVCNLIEAVRGTPDLERVIFASSQLVCRLGYKPKSDRVTNPTTLYGRSKALGEAIVRSTGDMGATWTIVRPTSLWGPWFAQPYRNLFEAIAGGTFVHIGSARPKKQWGYVGNSVIQLRRLLTAPAERVHGRTFYLADYQPTDLRTFSDKVQAHLGARPIRSAPPILVASGARVGDLLQRLGWKQPPLTTFRYRNMLTPELQDLGPLEQLVGPLPYDEDSGIRETVAWLRSHTGQHETPGKLPGRAVAAPGSSDAA